MEPTERDRAGLLKSLFEGGSRNRFFALLPLVEQLFPTAPRVGLDGPPRLEAMRFRHDPALRFSSGDIARIGVVVVPENGNSLAPPRHVIEIVTTFLGLTGSSSPLPNFMTELVAHEDQDHPVRRDFLDVFHHRAVSLLFRGVARLSIPREHTARSTTAWVKRGLALGGVDAYDVAPTRVLPLSSVMQLLPLLVGHARGARTLRTALRHVLAPAIGPNATVDLVENVEGWVELDEAQQMKLGIANSQLGASTHLGVRARERSGKFAIQIGPLTVEEYRRFVPGGDMVTVIHETVQIFTRNPVDYDLELVIGADASPAFTLSERAPATLGRTTWLAGRSESRTVRVRDAQRPLARTAEPPPI